MISSPCRTSYQFSLFYRDLVCPPLFAPCFRSSISWYCYCMTYLVFHAFASRSLSPGSRTSRARTRRLSLCVQSRRVCDVQQILEAVWWWWALGGCFRLFGVQSNWLVASDDISTFLLIQPFIGSFFSESSLQQHRWELSTPASVLVSYSDLCLFLCLSRLVQDRAFGNKAYIWVGLIVRLSYKLAKFLSRPRTEVIWACRKLICFPEYR